MKIKRFRAPDMRSALQQVRAEMGGDAVILQTRKIRRRDWRTLFGLLGRPWVEVTAAWDGGPQGGAAAGPAAPGRPGGSGTSPGGSRGPVPPAPGQAGNTAWTAAGTGTGAAAGTMGAAGPGTATGTGTASGPGTRTGPAAGPSPVPGTGPGFASSPRLDVTVGDGPLLPPRPTPPADATRERNGARPRADTAAASGHAGGRPPALPGLPPAGPPLAGVVVALGPTGAGKTTTLAKLAARATLEEGRTVALVAADTYRLAATAQLQAYADVLGVELAVAYSPAEVGEQVSRWRDRADLVLVDTAGRSFLLPEVIREMERVVAAAGADRVLLVLPATLSVDEADGLARAARGLGVTDLAITKVDESLAPGRLLRRAAAWGWPLALVGCGQRVPEDLLEATPGDLTPWLAAAAPGRGPVRPEEPGAAGPGTPPGPHPAEAGAPAPIPAGGGRHGRAG